MAASPGPSVSEPERGEKVEGCFVGSAVTDGESHQYVVGGILGVLGVDIEIAGVAEYAGIEEFEFGFVPAAFGVLFY